ncbi:nitroreductase family protein [Infirmifilum lucidum]|uniref:Nitroreductase family protein n=1 Tax=Infirmifilum lucidum TaxID=2776706 RepID=A0A7L9FKC8_9CREN|nr:nitroreductase family protein [Infirmifilum lucidum]QOJ79463.1 nitroreductase family protein [Infirmifilum lucidum]
MYSLPKVQVRDRPSLREALWCLANNTPLECSPCDVRGVARILFHVQGCRDGRFRTVPSAGATYPLEVYLYSRNELLPVDYGVYRYRPCRSVLEPVKGASVGFEGFAINSVSERTTSFYGSRGYRYVRQEIGHALQNLLLSLVSHGFAYNVRVVNIGLEGVVGEARVAEVEVREARDHCKGFLVERGAPLDAVIASRSSIRTFKKEGLSEEQLLTLLKWSTGDVIEGGRPYPKIFGSYLVETYVFTKSVKGLDPGVYYFETSTGELEPVKLGDVSEDLWRHSLRQTSVLRAPAVIILAGRGYEAEVECGIVGQNIYLNATHDGLGTVAIGAFNDENIARVTGVEDPLYLMPLGRPAP